MSDLMLDNLSSQQVVESRKNVRKRKRELRERKRKKKIALIFLSIFIFISAMYSSVAFLDLPYISTWRDIYIETAMTTADHKWLATMFFLIP